MFRCGAPSLALLAVALAGVSAAPQSTALDPAPITIDYPVEGAVFPPGMVAPTFVWHDPAASAERWIVEIACTGRKRPIRVQADGAREAPEIDRRCVTESNVLAETAYEATARHWTPDAATWATIQRLTVERDASVTIQGLSHEGERVGSSASVRFRTSHDPVGASIFYRDVPLMPKTTQRGVVEPLDQSLFPLIQWRLRDLSQPTAPIVMTHLPTCANCHSFSRDGKTLAMDMDGPGGDKGAYVVKDIVPRMNIEPADVMSWNDFAGKPEGQTTFGLFAQISPDGRHVVATLNEEIFVANYTDYRTLQTFYPTRGILVVYERATGRMTPLAGADDPRYVQANPTWSPDGQWIAFLRAEARPAYGDGPRPTYAGDPLETQIQYDVYRVPFHEGRGGTPEPILGASYNGKSNSFPKYSPDGRWIAYVQARNGLLLRPDGELFIVPAAGGAARRMRCNTTRMNSWHSWSPNGRWLVFSSKQNTPYTQMFLTHVDERGLDTPAILVPRSTAANRAVNLPEFVVIPPRGLVDITTPAVDYRRHLERARALDSAGQRDAAREELTRSLALKPDYWETHLTLGDFAAKDGDPAAAIEHYERALELNPRFLTTHLNLGIALGRLGRYDEALEHLALALALDPDNARTTVRVARVLSLLGDTERAERYFTRAVELDPTLAAAHFEWGLSLAGRGELERAIERFRSAVELDPSHYWAHYQWGRALERLGRIEEELSQLRAAIETGPAYAPAYDALALLLASYGDPRLRDGSEAVRLARIACGETGQLEPRYLETLAAAYAEIGRFDDARDTAERAAELARERGDTALTREIESHLALYRSELPLRIVFEGGRWRTTAPR